MQASLLSSHKVSNREKWNIDIREFKEKLLGKSAVEISQTFKRDELYICLQSVNEILKKDWGIHLKSTARKHEIVNITCQILGIESRLPIPIYKQRHIRTAKQLKLLAQNCVKNKISVNTLRIFVCQMKWTKTLDKWNENAIIKDGVKVTGTSNQPESWFSQPEITDTGASLFIPDAHHLLTNTRTKVCTSGLPKAGIKREAWIEVAKTNQTALKVAMVENLEDKQRNSFAQTTFSKDVEDIMIDMGFITEAKFCNLIRTWYQCVDEPSIPALQRVEGLLQLRDFLLGFFDIGKFPPPGSHIYDFPVTLWEGYVVSIERMLNLWGLIQAYNVRSVGTLDVEIFFGEFQELDPKGTGVLQPKDVACALSTACELIAIRFNPNRYL
jgi:hypothetical protein